MSVIKFPKLVGIVLEKNGNNELVNHSPIVVVSSVNELVMPAKVEAMALGIMFTR